MRPEPRQHVNLPRHELQRVVVHVRQPDVLQRHDAAVREVLAPVHRAVRPLPNLVEPPVTTHVPRLEPASLSDGIRRVSLDPRRPPRVIMRVLQGDEVVARVVG